MLSPNTILQSRYRIIRELGHGGMGTVYEAIDERVNCLVALKTTRAASVREAELLANLRHPALPKVTDYFSDKDGYFLVMEYIPGDDLAKLLEIRGRPFPESVIVQWADELLGVLQYLHSKQLLHRDIKPSNLKLTGDGELFLLDFGLAKGAVGQMPTLTSDKSVHGYTLQYAPLEQVLNQGTDARSDIYSLGATLYHLLTGVLPIDAYTRSSLIEKQGTDPLPLILKKNAEVRPDVASVIHRAMAIEPDGRPTSASEMLEALRKADGSRPSAPVEPKPKPTEPSPPAPAPPVSTMPAPPPPKPAPWNPTTLTDVQPVDPPSPAGSILKPVLIVIGVVLLLIGFSVAISAWRTGWVPWSDENLYGGQGSGPTSANDTPIPPSPVVSPSLRSSSSSDLPATIRDQNGMEFVLIKPGTFMMGADNGEDDERPVHQVAISNSFYIGKYEVTQTQWRQVMGSNPAQFQNCGDCPVESVSWEDAQKFIQRLNQSSDSYAYSLPTEIQWEYACRAGTSGDYAGALDSIAWYANNSGNNYFDAGKPSQYDAATAAEQYRQQISNNGNRPHPVGTKQANGFGLFDMAGNVSEWCEDSYHGSYVGAPTDGAAWLTGGDRGLRVVRGGAWYYSAQVSRSAYRSGYKSDERDYRVGFRVVAFPRTK